MESGATVAEVYTAAYCGFGGAERSRAQSRSVVSHKVAVVVAPEPLQALVSASSLPAARRPTTAAAKSGRPAPAAADI